MKEYIDIDKPVDILVRYGGGKCGRELRTVREILERNDAKWTPADIRARGKWMTHNNPCYSPFDGSSEVVYMCSLCEYLHDSPSNYCEWCGAEMRRGNV